jgi:exportin-T
VHLFHDEHATGEPSVVRAIRDGTLIRRHGESPAAREVRGCSGNPPNPPYSSGFSAPAYNISKSPPAKPVSEAFARAAEAILVALSELNTNGEIRAACRSAFSRLLGVLGNAVLPQLPQWIEGLLSRSSSKDEMAMFLRLLEQVVYGFKGEIYNVLDLLLTPLLERVFTGLQEPINGTDDEIQLQELRREYLAFIQVILANNLGGVLISTTNQQFFDPLINSIITLAKTVGHGNLGASRTGFSVLAKMAQQWGGPDVRVLPPQNPGYKPEISSQEIPGFGQFMIERFHTACWEVMLDSNFKPNDAQCRQVLGEIASVEQIIYSKTGDTFIHHLETTTLPQLGIDAQTFVHHLTSDDKKTFTSYLQSLVKGRRA